jgi:anti-anti-sigma factor
MHGPNWVSLHAQMKEPNEVLLEHPEYDISNVRDLERELRVLQPTAATIDMARVTYMDTTALRSLMRIGVELRSKAQAETITLKNTSPSMRRIFEVVGLGQIFVIK